MAHVPTRDEIAVALEAEDLRLLGLVGPDLRQDHQRFLDWLNRERHAGMEYLEAHAAARRDPNQVLAGVHSVIIFALPYFQPEDVGPGPRIAQYARFEDYHKLLRRRAEGVASKLFADQSVYRVVVDTAPVLERALAAKGARGFIGKNTCYIHPTWGSFLLLGEIFTSLPLVWDEPTPVDPHQHLPSGGCGICDRCQVKCPTGALNEDYSLDARLCLSYWTIEHRGTIPEKFWPHLGEYYFGCDICQLVCPYNRKQVLPTLPNNISRRKFPSLFETATMSQAQYEVWFGGTPLTRAKRSGLRRNALIAMRIVNDPRLEEALAHITEDGGAPLEETRVQIESYGR
jgi:epoxyqueuosine reductase